MHTRRVHTGVSEQRLHRTDHRRRACDVVGGRRDVPDVLGDQFARDEAVLAVPDSRFRLEVVSQSDDLDREFREFAK